MPIQRLRLKNFQGHEDTDIQFSSGLNVIVGTSDSGKSSLIRAVQWAATNRPVGTEYVRRGGDGSVGVLIEAPGLKLARYRDKTVNKYRLNGADLKAVGTDVPAQVIEALQFSPLNIQGQRDIDFLLGRSPGEVAQRLNDAVNLGLIDSSAASVNRSVLRSQRAVQAAESGLAEETAYLDRMKWVPGAAGKVATVKGLVSQLGALERDAAELERGLEGVAKAEADLKALAPVPDLDPVSGLVEKWDALCREAYELAQEIEEVEQATKRWQQADREWAVAAKQFEDAFPDECPLCGSPKDWRTVK